MDQRGETDKGGRVPEPIILPLPSIDLKTLRPTLATPAAWNMAQATRHRS
jgi:hypothetical protein